MSESSVQPSDWFVENMRFTAFLQEAVAKQPNWWEEITSEPPDKKTSHPKEGFFQDEGIYRGSNLILSINPFRVDWILRAYVNDPDLGLPIIGDLINIEKIFFELIETWLDISNPIKRIAFGAILLNPVQSITDGYKKISEFLPSVDIDENNSSDFLYQINRSRKSSIIDDLTINRLSKWSVAEINALLFEVNQDDKLSTKPFQGSRSIACRMELDINTSQHLSIALEKERLKPLLAELASLGNEIAEKGDIK